MNKLQRIGFNLSKLTKRTGLKIQHRSPEILLVGGIAAIGVGTVMACKATLRLEEVVTDAQATLHDISEVEAKDLEGYRPKDAQRDKTLVYIQTAAQLAKMYAPAVLVTGFGVASIVGSHKILKGRNLAAVAAYKALDETYNSYRRRVIEEFGEDKDHEYRYGVVHEKKKVTVTDPETGKKKKVDQTTTKLDPRHISQYAKFFDDGCKQWSKRPEYNLLFLKGQQNYHNDLLVARGHVFLNEVYDALGIPRTDAGAIVGWVFDKNDPNYIDFGMYDPSDQGNRDFINGYEGTILLDFNVDGVIWDKI